MLRRLCVSERRWLGAEDFEDAVAACNLLPGPASTQLSIFCAWRLAGPVEALVGGFCFIAPGLGAVLALSMVFLAAHPPHWVLGAGAGAGATVAAVALRAGLDLVPASLARATGRRAMGRGGDGSRRRRWVLYAALGGVAAATLGPWLVLVLLGCGVAELLRRGASSASGAALGALLSPTFRSLFRFIPPAMAGAVHTAGDGRRRRAGRARVDGLQGGGVGLWRGFVIVPLMRADAVQVYHWMSNAQFLDAVALGQVTPGPVTHTVAVVGYAAHGICAARSP
jgi:chromate transporter